LLLTVRVKFVLCAKEPTSPGTVIVALSSTSGGMLSFVPLRFSYADHDHGSEGFLFSIG